MDRPAELSGDEIANNADAVSTVWRSCNGRAADFAPPHHQARRIPVGTAVPFHLDPPMWGRQCAVFRSVRHQFVQHRGQRLSLRDRERDIWAADRRVCVRSIRRSLTPNEFADAESTPLILPSHAFATPFNSL